MRDTGGVKAVRGMPTRERQQLSAEDEAWIARQLAIAPPLSDESRRRIEALLALPPDNLNVAGDVVGAA